MKFPRGLAITALILSMGAMARPAPRTIYPDPGQARADVAAALKIAAQTHKRVLLDFGGNWCGDCIVLDMYLHNEQNRALLEANYVLVRVNVGHLDTNLDLAEQYRVPVTHGDDHRHVGHPRRAGGTAVRPGVTGPGGEVRVRDARVEQPARQRAGARPGRYRRSREPGGDLPRPGSRQPQHPDR